MEDLNTLGDSSLAAIMKNAVTGDLMGVSGKYFVQCHDKDGKLKWEDTIENLVTDAGKKFMLDIIFGTGTYTAVYLGLISGSGSGYSYTGPAALDTMASHAGWQEVASSGTVNTPNFATRGTPAFAAAVKNTNLDKATSAPVQFTVITNGGTVKGCFIVINGTSAIANTTGTLYSAGVFTGGDKVVAVSDTLNVSYTTSLTP